MGDIISKLKKFVRKKIGRAFFVNGQIVQNNICDKSKVEPLASSDLSRRSFLARVFIFIMLACVSQRARALDIKGVDYISTAYLAKRFGMKYTTLEAKKKQRVYGGQVKLDFEVHRRDMEINGQKVWLGFPVAESGGKLFIASRDLENTIIPILYPQYTRNMPNLKHIVLDAGHGGKDKGAIRKSPVLFEKTLTLDIVLRLQKILTARGYKVSLTRSTDTFIELANRPERANKLDGDAFVSVHINAASASASGLETYSLTPRWQSSTNAAGSSSLDKRSYSANAYDDWSTLLSFYVQNSLVSRVRAEDRGIKRARFSVLQDPKMPAILVECGFLSNYTEAMKLSSPEYRQKLALAIADGIARYSSTLARLKKK